MNSLCRFQVALWALCLNKVLTYIKYWTSLKILGVVFCPVIFIKQRRYKAIVCVLHNKFPSFGRSQLETGKHSPHCAHLASTDGKFNRSESMWNVRAHCIIHSPNLSGRFRQNQISILLWKRRTKISWNWRSLFPELYHVLPQIKAVMEKSDVFWAYTRSQWCEGSLFYDSQSGLISVFSPRSRCTHRPKILNWSLADITASCIYSIIPVWAHTLHFVNIFCVMDWCAAWGSLQGVEFVSLLKL